MCPCLRHTSGVRELESIRGCTAAQHVAISYVLRKRSMSLRKADESAYSRATCKNVKREIALITATNVSRPFAECLARVHREDECVAEKWWMFV